MNYLSWNEQTITDFSEANVASMYNNGYVFTRKGKGVMQQTRSVRIDLGKSELSSENRRIMKKTEGLENPPAIALPLREGAYDWQIGKLAKDFYDTKFEPGIMSSQKIKEMLTDYQKSNFNSLLQYSQNETIIGYAICFANKSLLHYSYPFYDLNASPKDMGLGMMIRAIEHAKNAGLKYIYLGSLQRPSDTYKLQFAGLEWFDGGPSGTNSWRSDIPPLRELLGKNAV